MSIQTIWSLLAKQTSDILIIQYLRWQLLIFHCKNIPDCVVESKNFLKRLGMLVLISSFNIPSRMKIGGKTLFLVRFMPIFANKLSGNLLGINFQAIKEVESRWSCQ